MQGVSAHLEYLRNDKSKERNVNCSFFIDGICFNTLSTKYGGKCGSSLSCLYSAPMSKKKFEKYKNKKDKDNKSKEINRTKNVVSLNEIINKNFNAVIETKTKVNDKYFKVIARYNKSKDSFTQEVYFRISGKEMSIRVKLKLKSIMRVTNDKIIFNIKLADIVNSLKLDGNNRAAKYINKVITEDIMRNANINDSVDIQNKIESIVKYIGHIVIRAYVIAIKADKLNEIKIKNEY